MAPLQHFVVGNRAGVEVASAARGSPGPRGPSWRPEQPQPYACKAEQQHHQGGDAGAQLEGADFHFTDQVGLVAEGQVVQVVPVQLPRVRHGHAEWTQSHPEQPKAEEAGLDRPVGTVGAAEPVNVTETPVQRV